MDLYITRHGETEWNLEGRLQGRLDSPLTELGVNQARALGLKLRDEGIELIISSPSKRAVKTAEIINEYLNLSIKTDSGLLEMDLGSWQGLNSEEIKETSIENFDFFWNDPSRFNSDMTSGESFEDIISRVSNSLENIILNYKNKYNKILIIGHGLVLKSIYLYIEKKPLKDFWKGEFMKQTNLNILRVTNNKKYFILKGDTSHLEEMLK